MGVQVDIEKQEKTRKIGLAVTLGCCLIGTIVTLIIFSQPGFHENTDNLFRSLISYFVNLWNTAPWGIVILIGALAVPLLGLFAVDPLDRITRRIPSGGFLLDHVKLSFEIKPGLRFLPAFMVIIYFVIGSFMLGDGNIVDFDPDSYNPFAYQYSAGEWVNWCFMVLTVFALFLIIAEGIVNAGALGIIIHIPVVLAANIYLTVLMVGIMFAAVTILGFIGKLFMSALAVSLLTPSFLVERKKKIEITIKQK